ncbi:MAG: hypothetical protein IPL73_24625 [Candidatus Obscuribacter sp.]|nr:hypothetical protein [Candidatus Obscuribacter sp.]
MKFPDPTGESWTVAFFLFWYLVFFVMVVIQAEQALLTDLGARANPKTYRDQPLQIYEVLFQWQPFSWLPGFHEYYLNLVVRGVREGDGYYQAGYIDGVGPAGFYTPEQINARERQPERPQVPPSNLPGKGFPNLLIHMLSQFWDSVQISHLEEMHSSHIIRGPLLKVMTQDLDPILVADLEVA